MTWKQCLVYIDDILIYSATNEQHLADLEAVLDRIIDANLLIKPSKCKFASDSVDFLGHTITKDGVKISPKKVDALLRIPPPLTGKKRYSFL
jgi:hypothetical protein